GHPVAALAAAGPAGPVRLPEALGWFAWHQHRSALLRPGPVGGADADRRLVGRGARVAGSPGRDTLRGGAADLRTTGRGPGGTGPPRAPGPAGAVAVPSPPGCLGRLPSGDRLTLVDPHLDADAAERGAGLEEPVLDVGTQRVQGHPA